MDTQTKKSYMKIKFPIAAIFTAILTLLSVINWFLYAPIYLSIGVSITVIWINIFLNIFPITFLCIVLFIKRRDTLLVLSLSILFLVNTLYCYTNFTAWRMTAAPVQIIYFLNDLIPTLCYLVTTLMAGFAVFGKANRRIKLFKKLWFVPGSFSTLCLFTVMFILTSDYNTIGFLSVLSVCFRIPMFFLLAHWIMYPYKRQKLVYTGLRTSFDATSPIQQSDNTCFNSAAKDDAMPKKISCTNCGADLSPEAKFCSVYGSPCSTSDQSWQPQYSYQHMNSQDTPSIGMAVLGFFFPVAGLILWLVWKKQYPLKSKSAGKGALIGAIVYVLLTIFITILPVVTFIL